VISDFPIFLLFDFLQVGFRQGILMV